MKKILILLLAAALFASCNSNSKGLMEKDDHKTGKRDKDDSDDRDDEDDRNDDRNRDDDNGGGSWSKKDRNKFLGDCKGGFTGQGYTSAQARQVCDCVLEKLEAKYSSLRDADERGGETAGSQAAMACMGGGGFQGDDGGGDYDDN
ncbi:MAG: hypothetical protein JNK14_14160 [Chitinophagaceae bacterium]|nr:hypothetical protein [Chitinophagaceae bacterium]